MHKNVETIKGKTIQEIDTSSINCWEIRFTDGSTVKIWAEIDGPMNLGQLWLETFSK